MIKSVICIGLFLLLTAGIADITSNSAPASSSGAPQEVNCTTSGCHDDNAINNVAGSASLTMVGGLTEYIPGNTYTVMVNVNQPNLNRFGFQVIAIRDADSSYVGELKVTDASRTQIISGLGNLIDRKYITYTYPGTVAATQGINQWSFEWQAPSTDQGPVTLYLAAIAANNDGTDAGDYCYLNSLKLTAPTVGIKQKNLEKQEFKIFPNPANEFIKIEYSIEKTSTVKFELYNLNGSKVQEWGTDTKPNGNHNQILNIAAEYPKGFYMIKFICNDKSLLKQIFIN